MTLAFEASVCVWIVTVSQTVQLMSSPLQKVPIEVCTGELGMRFLSYFPKK